MGKCRVLGAPFNISSSGRVQSATVTDGELSGFACFSGFGDFFAAEMGNHALIHRRIKDSRVIEMAAAVHLGLQEAVELSSATPGFGSPWRVPGPPVICRMGCGLAAFDQSRFRLDAFCCVRCTGTGGTEHAEYCERVNGVDPVTTPQDTNANEVDPDDARGGGSAASISAASSTGHEPEMERISRGSQIRSSAYGRKWAHLMLSQLLQIRCDPAAVTSVMEELANLADVKFSSKEVRQKGKKQDDFKSKLSRATKLMRVLTAHYSDWRAAFAAFRSRIFNVRGTLACVQRQEKMRGRVDDSLFDYIQLTTENFVTTRIDGSAPTSLTETPPFASATAATFGILLLFWKDFQMGVLWMLIDDSADLMSDIKPSPLAAVPKNDPATLLLMGDLRVVHAQNAGEHSINERTPRSRHPPAACP